MSKIFDGLVGFVIGDAMGVPLEFKTRERLIENPTTEMIGFGTHDVPAGSWSDDTSMTIATIDSIIEKKNIDYENIMKKWYEWVVDYKYTPSNFRFDIGHTCAEAIYNYAKKDKKPLECGLSGFKDNGNGSLMRILPLAYYIYYKNITDENKIVELVNDLSSLTHAHEISKMGCYIYVKYILSLLNGKNKEEAYNAIKNIDYKFYSDSTIEIYNRILKEDISKYNVNDIKSTGYVVDTLEACLWVFLNTDTFAQALIGSINLGNDTDTIGAITGSMAGIVYGFNNIPKRWFNKIIKKEYLCNMFNDFEMFLCNGKKDTLVGAMVGDIVGSRFELNNCKKRDFVFMARGKSRVTDDTVMTLAVAKAFNEADNSYAGFSDLAIKNMVEVGRKYQQCGFGKTFFNWIKSDNHEPYNSYGNGAAMRISPVGIMANSEEEVKDLSFKVTAVSHNHPDGIKGAEAVAMMIYLIKNGYNKEQLKEYFIKNYYPIDFTLDDLYENYKFKISCSETVPQAFVAFYESINFDDAIRNAIMIGGDSDTIGAICGSIAATYYGIPDYIINETMWYLDDYLKNIYIEFNEKIQL